MSGGFVKVDELKEYYDLVQAAEKKQEEHVVLKYGGPCMEYANRGDVHVFYGAPCNFLDTVDFQGKDYLGLRYGGPCKPPYIVVKYGGPCKELRTK